MYQDDCRLKGVVNLVLRDKDGKVKQHKTIRNKVTRAGIAHIIGRMIDDGQDRAGKHKMPRMMSHMAVGIGAAARSNKDTYTSVNFDNLPLIAGRTGSASATSRKKAASPEIYDRMLQDERGFRVQLMKDTTKAGDYSNLENVRLQRGVDGNGANVAIQDPSDATKLRISTGSDGGLTVKRLRKGLQIVEVGNSSPASTDISGSNITITNIEASTPHSTLTTITLSQGLGANAPAAGNTDLYIDVKYIQQIDLTTYSTVANMPNHPTHTHVKSQFQMQDSGADGNLMGPFGAAATRGAGGVDANIDNTTGFANGVGPYTEAGVGLLGISRGQIGAFYEREIEHNIDLLYTNGDGLALPAGSNYAQAGVPTTTQEAGYAVLDVSGNTYTARFPFVGAEEDKPQGVTQTGLITDHKIAAGGTRGTEFVQFGTAVDGIFQGELVGSSIVADGKDTMPEGYPEGENDYATVGGLTVTNAGAGDQHARYNSGTGNAFVAYQVPGQSYSPNAVAGNKKNGDRVVYVATFKENNPRPENDYNRIHTTNADGNIAPENRVYPITEAGIFNKHIKDLGIFDVGNRTYTNNDADVNNIAHIDTRNGVATPTQARLTALGDELEYSAAGGNEFPPIDGVLTPQARGVTAAAYGFTRGPLTQTMLCRTTFDPVNKATADTLQITWSVQLQDNTTAGS